MRHTLVLASLTTLFASAYTFAAVDPFMEINFESDTLGNAPSTQTSPNTTALYGFGGYDPNYGGSSSASVLVGSAPGIAKGVALTTDAADGTLGAVWIDTAFGQTSQRMNLSFDLHVASAPTTATVQPKTLNGGPATAGIMLGMNTYTSTGGWATRFAVAPTSETGGVFAIRSPDNSDLQSFFNYVEGGTYNIRLESNYDTGMVTTYVDNVNTGNYAFWAAGMSDVYTQEFFFHLNGEVGNANAVVLDNITGAVPEPATLGLLGLGGLMLGRRRR